jgi:hypothetical protein
MRSLVLTSLLLSATAIACPDLSGSYPVCRSHDPEQKPDQNMVVTQTVENGVSIYNMTATDGETEQTVTQSFRADGRDYPQISYDGPSIDVSYSTSCIGESLVVAVKISAQESSAGALTSTMTKEGNALITRTTGNVMGIEVSEETICE